MSTQLDYEQRQLLKQSINNEVRNRLRKDKKGRIPTGYSGLVGHRRSKYRDDHFPEARTYDD